MWCGLVRNEPRRARGRRRVARRARRCARRRARVRRAGRNFVDGAAEGATVVRPTSASSSANCVVAIQDLLAASSPSAHRCASAWTRWTRSRCGESTSARVSGGAPHRVAARRWAGGVPSPEACRLRPAWWRARFVRRLKRAPGVPAATLPRRGARNAAAKARTRAQRRTNAASWGRVLPVELVWARARARLCARCRAAPGPRQRRCWLGCGHKGAAPALRGTGRSGGLDIWTWRPLRSTWADYRGAEANEHCVWQNLSLAGGTGHHAACGHSCTKA